MDTLKGDERYAKEKLYNAAFDLVDHRSIRDRLMSASKLLVVYANDFTDEEDRKEIEDIHKAFTKAGTLDVSLSAMSDIEAGELAKKILRFFLANRKQND